MDDTSFTAWFSLAHAPGLGRAAARALLARHGGEVAAAQALPPPAHPQWSRWLDHARRWREGEGRHVLALDDARYPALLLQTADPPLLLYVQGDPQALGQTQAAPCLAVVGSRQPTPQGRAHARAFSRAFSQAGVTVVSGLALGVDGQAHEGALEGPSPTVAVVGTGPDLVYPSRHRELARRIAGQGAIVSEYAPGTPSRPEHFPQRNRLIAGLSRGTLVVEAALQSGSLITARLAGECGREVFAIPGSIDSPQSRGCHALIRQGAMLVESPEEVLQELLPERSGLAAAAAAPGAPALPPEPSPQSSAVLQALGWEPVDFDQLAARTGLPSAELSVRLLELELDGHVSRLPGGLFQRCAAA